MEIKENKHEKASSNAINEVNSSIMLEAEVLEMCKDVTTKRQNPNRFAAVLSICWEVLFGINGENSPFWKAAYFQEC